MLSSLFKRQDVVQSPILLSAAFIFGASFQLVACYAHPATWSCMERYVHLECDLCGERLYTDLSDFLQREGSQPHLEAEVCLALQPQ